MIAPPMRPRFQVVLEIGLDDARDRITDPLSEAECPVEGLVAGQHMELKIPREERHFWSPHLSVEVEAEGESTRLRGLFGPRPSVWTMFATFYLSLAFIAFFGAALGTSQWMIDKNAWGFWALPATAVGFLTAYFATLFGQRLGSDQMETLREYLRRCFDGVTIRSDESVAESTSTSPSA